LFIFGVFFSQKNVVFKLIFLDACERKNQAIEVYSRHFSKFSQFFIQLFLVWAMEIKTPRKTICVQSIVVSCFLRQPEIDFYF